MLLSIILITYNRAHLLESCLKDITPLTFLKEFSNTELLIADNCSTDSTQKVIKTWISNQKSHENIRTLRQRVNLGAIPNFINALGFAKGKYAILLGDDDSFDVIAFKSLHSALNNSEDFSIGIESDYGDVPGKVVQICTNLNSLPLKLFKQGSALYKFGNAWSGIYNVTEAKKLLKNQKVRELANSPSWGHAAFGFLIPNSSALPVALFGKGYGFQKQERPFAQAGLSILNSLQNLHACAVNLDALDSLAGQALINVYKKWNSPGNTHLYILLRSTPRELAIEIAESLRKLGALAEAQIKLTLLTRTLFHLSSKPRVLRFASFMRRSMGDKTSTDKSIMINHY